MIKVKIDDVAYDLNIEMWLGDGPEYLTTEDLVNLHNDTVDYVYKTLPAIFVNVKRMTVLYNTTRLVVDVKMESTLTYNEYHPVPNFELKLSVDKNLQGNKWFGKTGYETETAFAVKVVDVLAKLISSKKNKKTAT